MKTNKILERIQKGEKALGIAPGITTEVIVELAGRMGLDFVSFDGQHTAIMPDTVERLCRVADGYGVTVSMRIPDHDESTILSYLDRGVKLIIVPNLLTADQAKSLVKYAYYAPKGLRSATATRMVWNSGSNDRAHTYEVTNANTIVVPQLESIVAINNLDEILAVDGIDYYAGGAEDLAQSMGLSGQPKHPKVTETFEKAKEKIRSAGKGIISDHMETVPVLPLAFEEARKLLEKHGRKSRLEWSM